ncbi:hypothetical protein PPSIR1_36487 [Plesiocystis pacifica SIR-1]|uniref:Acyl carrier protein phosphodiesterase n=1 Tax=Plesiocystis pacifica SIR-1 TaxID=391625 RepID=A6G1K2_9BACT|nr:hypothetical protein [Plesiocystis pacifica]EDM80266.1 hypothetical protein PPSIR1_36487 [Plesiocystis pacifica SIR-1]
MNFFSHAVLAARRSEEPEYIVGSMAPDFASMAGMRLTEIRDTGSLAAGVDFHHRSDDAFHGAPIFVELMEDARIELEERGLGFGPAAAIGHVGVELVLDGWLVDELGEVPESYRAAMRAAADVDQRLRFYEVDYYAGCRRWRDLCSRLLRAPVPEGYRDGEFVAARLVQILSRRPRLAVAPGDEPEVVAWAKRAYGVVGARAPALLDQVEERLVMLAERAANKTASD